MGTPFDFFGEEASHGYDKSSDEVLNNRIVLKVMTATHFDPLIQNGGIII
jgi:D-alanyl-D-alanine dipeptidase